MIRASKSEIQPRGGEAELARATEVAAADTGPTAARTAAPVETEIKRIDRWAIRFAR